MPLEDEISRIANSNIFGDVKECRADLDQLKDDSKQVLSVLAAQTNALTSIQSSLTAIALYVSKLPVPPLDLNIEVKP
jgi:hypothetical protein